MGMPMADQVQDFAPYLVRMEEVAVSMPPIRAGAWIWRSSPRPEFDFAARFRHGTPPERMAASFVLQVFVRGPHGHWSGLPDFDASLARRQLDPVSCRVIADWLAAPWWP